MITALAEFVWIFGAGYVGLHSLTVPRPAVAVDGDARRICARRATARTVAANPRRGGGLGRPNP